MSGQTENVDHQHDDDATENERETGTSDDKCIGNRQRRTWILCLLLLAFSVFAAGYLFLQVENAKNQVGTTSGCAICEESAASRVHGANAICAGLVLIMIFAILTMILVCVKSCDVNKRGGCVPGIGLVLGGSLYIFGWVWYIGADKEMGYNFLTDDEKQEQDAIYLSWFGEALLYAATVILLGIDLMLPHRFLLEDEFKRLFCNLGILCAQSVLTMPAYFLLSGVEDGVEAIGTGYIVICVATATYIILFITSCCHNCKDNNCVRVVLAIAIVVGGVLTAFGYYVFAGGHDTLGDPGDDAKRVAYYIGYTILIGGLCIVWGLDIVWDDIKDD
eukprot:151786_1